MAKPMKNLELHYPMIQFLIICNFPPKGRWIVVDIHRDAKRRGIYPPLFTDPNSCFIIYWIRWIKKRFFNFFSWTFRETKRHFSPRSQNKEYPTIFKVTGANQNARKLLSTDLVNTNKGYSIVCKGRQDSPKVCGGGVLIYVREGIPFTRQTGFVDDNFVDRN